jgi:glycosyltransferase involved in cell wall biosynthesis
VIEAAVGRAKRYFQRIATGSSWCTDVLQNCGLHDATTVIQGVDPLTFHPSFAQKEYLHDRFIIFSGGKLELRKGHDLVVRAYKSLQDRHAGVMLVCSWHNLWEHSLATIGASPHVKFQLRRGDTVTNTKSFLADNGIDLDRVCVLPLRPNEVMARVYQNTDIGLFPNRCEGGTNLVLMEYMACGKPVIAGYSTGHRDIVNDQNALLLHPAHKIKVSLDSHSNAEWDDYNVDDVVDRLEWAYQHRDQLRPLAHQAGEDLSRYTWKRTADQFLELLFPGETF